MGWEEHDFSLMKLRQRIQSDVVLLKPTRDGRSDGVFRGKRSVIHVPRLH